MKIKLDKSETAMLMAIKGHKIILSRKWDDYIFTGNDAILNKYPELVKVYADRTLIEPEYLKLNHITMFLLDIFHKCCYEKYRDLLIDIGNRYDDKNSYIVNLFNILIGKLVALQMIKDGVSLFELDYSVLESERRC